VKRGNMRTYGTVLTEKLVSEKCTTMASPCVRYFVDASGNRISEPDKVVAESAYIEPAEYRKRVDNLKRDEKGKFVKMETTPFEIPNTPGNYQAIDKLVEGTEALSGASKEDEGGIVRKGDGEGPKIAFEEYFKVEFDEQNRVPGCFGGYDPIMYCCRDCTDNVECKETSNKVKSKETKDDIGVLAEPESELVPEYAGEPEIWPCRPKPEKETPDQMWAHVAYYIGSIKQQGIRRVEEDIQARLDKILGGR